MAIRIQLRRDTAANWVSANPVLRAGEIGIETDTLKFKIGTGAAWNSTSNYANVTPDSLGNSLGDYILLADQGAPGGPAELNSNGNLIIPEDSIVLWNDAAYNFTTSLTATAPTANRTITFPDATGTIALTTDIAAGAVTETGTQTLTNKSISLSTNTITSTLAQLNTAVSDADVASLAGTETLTNKTLTAPVIASVLNGNATITMPVITGTVALTSDISAATGGSVNETGTQTLTNKSMSFGSNTFTGTLAQFNTAVTDADLAPIASPTFTGTPTLPSGTIATTQTAGDNSTAVATTAFVGTAVANLVDSSPELLNTLDEIAAAIGDDPNFAATISTSIGLKAPLESPTFTGTVSGITSTMVGLGSVDNTADSAKPVSTATQSALDLKLNLTDPAVDYYIANSGSGAYLVNGVSNGNIYFEKGKKYRIHVNASGHPFWIQTSSGEYNSGSVYSTGITNNGAQNGHILVELASNAPQLYYACQFHSSMAGSVITGTTFATYKALADLSNVDNTSDANKPVSSATQTALDLKVDESLFDAKGDLLVASADNTPAKLTVGTNGYLLTANSEATNGVEWAAAPVSLPSQTGNNGYYLTTDGTNASWGTLVVPITTGTATITANTATAVDTTALSAFTSIEYMVSLKQGSKIRTSKVVVQTDGTSVDMTEFAITETGGTIAGVVVSAAVASTNGVLQVTATDATTTNVTVKFSKIRL